jgi:hypothetical protein
MGNKQIKWSIFAVVIGLHARGGDEDRLLTCKALKENTLNQPTQKVFRTNKLYQLIINRLTQFNKEQLISLLSRP